MYNVKFFKYPSGWQVRVYSDIVGIKDRSDEKYFSCCSEEPMYPLWDASLQDYVYERVPWGDTWFNPFDMREEKAPVEFDEKENARKKERSAASSMGRTVNAIYRIARANTWDWFITLTFSPAKVDSLDYAATVKKLSVWLNNMKKQSPGLGYLVVPEKHKSGRYHFHGLFKGCGSLNFVPTGKYEEGLEVYNVGSYKLGWTTATKVRDQSRVTKYIAKYISKDLCQVAFGRKRYWASRNLDAPETCEVILDSAKLRMLTSHLERSASYVKRIENPEVTVTIYELPGEVCNGG